MVYIWKDAAARELISAIQSVHRGEAVQQLIVGGYTNKQIVEILTLSIKTEQAHRCNLMQKLYLHDRGELIKYAIQKKIIEN